MSINIEWQRFVRQVLKPSGFNAKDIANARGIFFAGADAATDEFLEIIAGEGKESRSKRVLALTNELKHNRDQINRKAAAEREREGRKK